MKTQRESAMDLICYTLKRGAILLTWDDGSGPGVYVFPAYSLPHPVERQITAQSRLIRELLTSLAYDPDPPPAYSLKL